ncbi:CHAT domain-containing protein [Streptomyces koyangensis]|uniref:CHAT domain-containing protein n=1 Tax=Streptomyces koyangensis TaxID=188770 RepID=UPI003C2B389C
MLFVLLLVPWALPRPDGTRTALQHALLRAAHGKVLTEARRRDLTGAREVTGLLIGIPAGEEFRRQCESNRQDIERMPAAARPTESALRLAVPPGAPAGAGRLTVAGILDAFADLEPGPAGPLVVLSACETDLSGGHHDEALTVATALVASGAADVVGSRWAVRDGPTSVMTAVLHHHLTEGRLAPPDAQLWMLDPHREPPPTLTGPLRGEATRPDLHELCHWAAFTQQGNPAPGRPISLA